MKKITQRLLENKQKSSAVLTGVLIGGSATNAMADVPEAALAAITTFGTDAGTFIDSFWVPIIVVVLGFAYFRFFKKGVATAS